MPVIGHTLVGLATAIQFEPRSDRKGLALGPAALALWVPLVVVVSYVPDILSQLGSMAGVARASLAGHSIAVGVFAGALIGALWAVATGLSYVRLMSVSIGAILFHDLLDILQATDRAPFWPWSTRIVTAGALLPRRSFAEGALFLSLLLAFIAWRKRAGLSLGSLGWLVDLRPRSSSPLAWAARAAIIAILATAVGTRTLRSRRERAAKEAAELNAQGRYADALRVADTADRWPWPVRPGRLDIIRGEAHDGMGQSTVAEQYFLHAYEEDPTNFWAVADLAEFYATRTVPVAERRRLAEPYTQELRQRFPRHEQLTDVLARVERKLDAGS